MTRTQTACYCLIASAFVLAALVVLQASRLVNNEAHAEMVVTKNNITMLTAQGSTDYELVYVLDSRNGNLLAYLAQPNRRSIELVAAADVRTLFLQGMRASADATDRTRTR